MVALMPDRGLFARTWVQRVAAPFWRLLRGAVVGATLTVVAMPALAQAAGALSGRTIVVDPGHGGADSGAVADGVMEKTVTLAIGLDLGSYLRGAGARVVFTRTADVTVGPGGQRAGLATRAALANRVGAAAYVSVHANSLSDPTYRGVMTFYGRPSGYVDAVRRSSGLVAASRTLARDVQQAVIGQTGAINRGVNEASFYVLGNAALPSVLVETGFLTNPTEARRLTSPAYQRSVASGIAQGLERFFRDPAPAPSPGDKTAPAVPAPPEADVYVVRPGDTLSAIAERLGVTASALAARNGLDTPNLLVAGRTLRLPGAPATYGPAQAASALAVSHSSTSRTYTVAAGDTLSAIAVRFHVGTTELARANGLRDPNEVVVGQTLTLPGQAQVVVRRTGSSRTASASAVDPGLSTPPPSSSRYTVRPGDTLSELAQRFGVSAAALAWANGLSDPNHLVVGQILCVDVGSDAQRQPVACATGQRSPGR